MDKVWVLTIEHKHGTNVTVHRSFSSAHRSVVAYVDEFWDNVGPVIDDPNKRIEFYFDHNDDEFYSIQHVEVED